MFDVEIFRHKKRGGNPPPLWFEKTNQRIERLIPFCPLTRAIEGLNAVVVRATLPVMWAHQVSTFDYEAHDSECCSSTVLHEEDSTVIGVITKDLDVTMITEESKVAERTWPAVRTEFWLLATQLAAEKALPVKPRIRSPLP